MLISLPLWNIFTVPPTQSLLSDYQYRFNPDCIKFTIIKHLLL